MVRGKIKLLGDTESKLKFLTYLSLAPTNSPQLRGSGHDYIFYTGAVSRIPGLPAKYHIGAHYPIATPEAVKCLTRQLVLNTSNCSLN